MTRDPKQGRYRAFRSSRDLLGGFLQALADPGVRILLGLTTTAVLIAAFVYVWLEGWSMLDSFYFAVVTIATVGYGDLAPSTPASKIFTIVYLVIGIGLFVALASAVAGHLIYRARVDLGLDPLHPEPADEAADRGDDDAPADRS